jgi:hypothetical protein
MDIVGGISGVLYTIERGSGYSGQAFMLKLTSQESRGVKAKS